MMSAVHAEEETISMTPTEPATSAPTLGPGVNSPTPTKDSRLPRPPTSPETPLPAVVDGIDGTAGGAGNKKADKWNAAMPSISSLKSWMSEAVRISKDTAHTAQRAVAAAAVRRDARPRILCVGDSLTEGADALAPGDGGPGWGALLRARYQARGEVLSRGCSGYNSRWALSVLPRVLHSVDPSHVRAVLLWFGANDAVAAGGAQHVPLEEYRFNLSKMANFVLSFKSGGDRIVPVLVTPPALCDEMRFSETGGDPKRTAMCTKEYADACVEVACGLKVPFVDVHSAMLAQVDGDGSTQGVGRFLSDGLHFNTAGNALVENLIVEVLETHLPKYAPSSAVPAFMPWKEINVDNPAESLGSAL